MKIIFGLIHITMRSFGLFVGLVMYVYSGYLLMRVDIVNNIRVDSHHNAFVRAICWFGDVRLFGLFVDIVGDL
jgi:hypothetical protein